MIVKTRLAGILFIIILLALIALPVGAQGKSLPFAAITQNQLVLYGVNDAPVAVQLPGGYQQYHDPVWSPDGRALIITAADQNYNWKLFMVPLDGTQPTVIVDNLLLHLPVSFTPEGYLLLSRKTGESANDPLQSPILEIYTASSAAPIASLGRVTFGEGCGGGSSNPAHWLYWNETNASPGNSPRILAQTPFGIVHSNNCTGRGVSLLDTNTGTDTELHDKLGWIKISPDGTKIAGIVKPFDDSSPSQALLIDLASRTVTPLPIDTHLKPDQVFWGTTANDLYFSTTITTSKIPADEADQIKLGEMFGSPDPTTLPVNAVEIHHLDLAANADVVIYSGSAYALGRLAVTPDGAGILFSLIPNEERWVEAILDGSLNSQENNGENLLPVELYYLDMASGATSLIGIDMAQFAFNAGVYAAQ